MRLAPKAASALRALPLIGVLALVAISAGTPGCASSNEDSCGQLRSALKKCGMPVVELDCGRIDRTSQEGLLSRLGKQGCQGVSDADADGNAVDPRLCALARWSCPDSPTPTPAQAVTKYPVVFVSGIDGSPAFDWNPRILEAVKKSGSSAHHVGVLPWATTRERGADLWASLETLRQRLDGKKLNLVCYAVGGLDCRYVASPGGLMKGNAKGFAAVQSTIASVTTISTPHRGTRVAEAALSALKSGTANELLQTLVGAGIEGTLAIPDDAALGRTLEGLTLAAALKLNAELTDGEGIEYQSWAGVSHVLGKTSTASEESIRAHCTDTEGSLLFQRHKDTRDAMSELLWITTPFGGTSLNDNGAVVQSPTDGMVSVESAKWGTFRGCIPADHYDVIGQIGHTTRDPLTGFDAPRFYRYLAGDLATRGF